MDARDQERIEAYVLGELDEKSKNTFEKEISRNPELAEKVALHGRFLHGVEEHFLRGTLEELHLETEQKAHKVKRLRLGAVWSTAAAVILIFGFFWYWQIQPGKDYLELIDPLVLDPGLPTTLSGNSSLEFGEGMNAYKLQDYATANNYWNPLLEADPQNDTLLFYMAQVEISQGKISQSIEKLAQVAKNDESIFGPKALWYLALGKLNQRKTEEAKILLQEIINSKSPKAKEAETLLKVIP